jgi:hypothetical protein
LHVFLPPSPPYLRLSLITHHLSSTWLPPPPTHPNPFPQSVLFFLSTSWLKIPETTILLTNVLIYIVCLSFCLSGFQFAFGFSWRFWWQVPNQSCKTFFRICLYICATYSVLLTLDKTWWGGPQLCSKGRVTTSVRQFFLFDPVISLGPDLGTK